MSWPSMRYQSNDREISLNEKETLISLKVEFSASVATVSLTVSVLSFLVDRYSYVNLTDSKILNAIAIRGVKMTCCSVIGVKIHFPITLEGSTVSFFFSVIPFWLVYPLQFENG